MGRNASSLLLLELHGPLPLVLSIIVTQARGCPRCSSPGLVPEEHREGGVRVRDGDGGWGAAGGGDISTDPRRVLECA